MLIQNFIDFIKSKKDFNPKTILDIGSRDLDQSIEFSSIYPDAKIYAFEPNPDQFEICYKKANNYSNIQAHKLAISDKKGTLDFYKTLGNIGASSLLEPIDVPFASSQDVEKISVDSDRLDSWMNSNNIQIVDIMWMDTQGVELLALKSMGDHIKNVRFIHCEASQAAYYKDHILKNDLEEFLINCGFEIEFHPCPHPYGEGDIFAYNKNI